MTGKRAERRALRDHEHALGLKVLEWQFRWRILRGHRAGLDQFNGTATAPGNQDRGCDAT
jgi:hypothetical protein